MPTAGQYRTAITKSLTDYLIGDLIGVVSAYSIPLDHIWSDPTANKYRLTDGGRTATATGNFPVEVFGRHPFLIANPTWTVRVPNGAACIGFSSKFFRPKYRINPSSSGRIEVERNGMACLRNQNWPPSYTGYTTATFSIRTDDTDPSSSVVSVVLNGIDIGVVFFNVQNVDKLYPEVFGLSASLLTS